MSLGYKRYSWPLSFSQRGQRIGESRTLLNGAELTAFARGEAVAELVDRPQVDACGIEGESIPVVETGVFTEPMQEYHRSPRICGGPMPVVHPPALVIEERHGLDCTRIGVRKQDGARYRLNQGPSRLSASSISEAGPANDNRANEPPLTVSKSTPGAIAKPVSANSLSQNFSESAVKSERSA